METHGIVIWAGGGSHALILWCADNGGLVYVADRRQVGDRNAALCVGDLVDLRVETLGAMRVGRDLRMRAAGAGWIQSEIHRTAGPHRGPVIARDPGLAQRFGFGAGPGDGARDETAANAPHEDGTGTG